MMKDNQQKIPGCKGNGWVSCGIGSGSGKSTIWRCEKCAWEAEVSAWKPAACPRCNHPFRRMEEENHV